jgi:hypothetical protein
MMRIRTKIDLSVALIQTAQAHNNHRPVKDNGLSEQMKEMIALHQDKTASQIKKEIQVFSTYIVALVSLTFFPVFRKKLQRTIPCCVG